MSVGRQGVGTEGLEQSAARDLRNRSIADLPQFLTPEEFRTLVSISRTTVYDLLRRGEIPHIKFGRSIRIPKAALERAVGACLR